MKKYIAMFGIMSLLISSVSFAGDDAIRSEMAALAVAQQQKVHKGIEKGVAVDSSQNLLITAEQAENLFESFEISSGVVPGEERGAYVVCSQAGISMGNIDIAKCRIEKRAPGFMKKK